MLEEWLKSTVEEAEKEMALRVLSKANLQDKGATLEVAKKRIVKAEKTAVAEKKVADFKGKLGEAKIRFVQAENVIPARDKEVANLKEAWQRAKTNLMTWDLPLRRIPAS